MMTLTLLGLAAAGIGAMFLSVHRDVDARSRRKLRKTTRTPIQRFAEGSAGKIVGRVDDTNTTLKAPLSGRRCVYYSLTVQAEQPTNEGTFWREVVADHSAQNFQVSDETGTALILMDDARVSLAGDASPYVVGTIHDFSEAVRNALLGYHEAASGLMLSRRVRYQEHILAAGTLVAVMGHGIFQPDPDPRRASGNYRGATMQLTLRGNRATPLVVSDDPAVTSS